MLEDRSRKQGGVGWRLEWEKEKDGR